MGNVIPTNIDEAIARIDDWKGKEISESRVCSQEPSNKSFIIPIFSVKQSKVINLTF